jgi:hypothetical protein
MNSQITVQDFGGKHNENIDATRARLLKGASWRKQRVIVLIPTDALMPAKTALAMWNLIFPPNQGVVRFLIQGMEVGDAYSSAIENILAHDELKNWEYLLTLEHDNLPPQDGVLKLIERMESDARFSCIGGLYFTKGEGGVAQIWGDINDSLNFRPQVPVPGKIIECYGTGMGFNLWRLSMFKDVRLRRPFFKTACSKEGVGTQDLQFWVDARKYGYRCAVDCAIQVGHYDHVNDIVW